MTADAAPAPTIGLLNEKPLHAALKAWCARDGDRFEVRVGRFVIDIVRAEGAGSPLLIEIQTRHLYALKRKLTTLVESYPVRLVHPIPAAKWIVRLGPEGEVESRRRSPRRGRVTGIFAELVSFPRLLEHPNFSLQVLLTEEEEVRVRDETVNWRRRGWATQERRLLRIIDEHVFEQPADLLRLLPAALPDPFTPVELARALGESTWLARKATYCLCEAGQLAPAGKRGRSRLFARINI